MALLDGIRPYTGRVIRNIIFDWSGTLVDDLPAVWKATNHVLNQAQCAEMTLDTFRAEFCLPFTLFYDKHTPKVPLSQLEIWYNSEFPNVQGSICALPHAREFLQFCRARNLKTFILSAIHPDHFAVQMQSIDFNGLLDECFVGVRDKRHKIHEILSSHALAPDETLFIGDMQHDIETAVHGGVHSCAVLTGYNTLEQLRQAKPDLIVEHLGELQHILERNDLRLKPDAKPFEELHGPIATVGALIFDEQGRVLMVRTHKWSDLWGIPGGKIKWGEPSIDALRREIKEETDLTIDDIQFTVVQDCIHSREFYRDAHFILMNYTCRCVGEPRVRLNDEAREFRWVTLQEALEMPLNQPTRVLVLAVREQMNSQKG
ncbi:MAG TPA: NUDIX domain-containing protein [Verrucomicrobiae bacterium]|nr:NUDIX domain-containing protein [Verrucomicrobiae bacterium]